MLSGGALADDFVGQASVVDGDTLEIHGIRIRLWGVDAPESSQLCRGEDSLQYRCGAQAANDLDTFIARRPVNCLPLSLDPYGRTVATCSVHGADLGEWLVRNGLALDCRNIRKASTPPPSATPIVRVAGCGRAAMWSRGCFAAASGRVVLRPTVRMMQTHILERAVMGRLGASTVERLNQRRSELARSVRLALSNRCHLLTAQRE